MILFMGLDLLKDSTAALPANVTVNNFDKETYCFGFNQEKVVSSPKWPELETLEKEVLENAKKCWMDSDHRTPPEEKGHRRPQGGVADTPPALSPAAQACGRWPGLPRLGRRQGQRDRSGAVRQWWPCTHARSTSN